MKYLTRDQLLYKLGPMHALGPVVFAQKPEAKFPVAVIARATTDESTPPSTIVATIEYRPYSWSRSMSTLSVVLSAEEYEALVDDPTLDAEQALVLATPSTIKQRRRR